MTGADLLIKPAACNIGRPDPKQKKKKKKKKISTKFSGIVLGLPHFFEKGCIDGEMYGIKTVNDVYVSERRFGCHKLNGQLY